MKKWVELKRDSLDIGDVGKRVRPFGQEYKVTSILSNGQEVELDGPIRKFVVTNDRWTGIEIEEEQDHISTLTLPSGSSINFSNLANGDISHDPLFSYGYWPTPDREKPLPPAHDCYLSGHKFVDTGMRVSWCSECSQDAVWDQATATFKAVRKA